MLMSEQSEEVPSAQEDVIKEGLIHEAKTDPNYFITTAVLKAQNSLEKENIKDGIAKFSLYMEMCENIALSTKLINEENYNQEIEAFIKGLSPEIQDYNKNWKIANFKLKLITAGIIKSKAKFGAVIL